MTRVLRGFTALTLLWTGSLAAQDPIADRFLNLPGKGAPEVATCKLQGGDFHTGSSATYLQSALTNGVADNKRHLLGQAHDQALIGIQGGQAGSSKAWYYLGRVALQQGDLVGADSAFTRTVQLAPGCVAEVNGYRTAAYRMLITAAAAHRTAGRGDSAVYLARAATRIDPSRPQGWYTIGAQFLEAQQNDSAALYLEKALGSTGDTSAIATSIRQAAAYQAGVVAYNRHDFPASVRLFAEAVRLKSDDNDAKRNLASSLRQAGMADSATKVEGSMMAAAAGSEAGLGGSQLAEIGVARYNAGDFAGAIVAFEKIVEVEPYNRDALFNLAQSYKGAGNTDKQLETATRLRAIEPLSFAALQIIGQAYQTKKDQPNILKTFEQLTAATVEVTVDFAATATGATLTMHAKGREARDINDRPVRPAAIPLVVEFLDKAGTVVTTGETTIPPLAKDATQDLTVTGTGAGIAAWRYHRK
jgi:tetratricopeptide (TPR) repeat protein